MWMDTEISDTFKTFLYMCFFVNNQFRMIVDGADVSNLDELFESNLLRIGKIVALLDGWDAPVYSTRVWTIFEQFTAVKLDIPVKMIMPMDAFHSLSKEINQGITGILAIKESLSKIDSQNAEASRLADTVKVKTAIRESVGFEKVNSCVKDTMIKWVGDVVTQTMRGLVFDDTDPDQTCSIAAWGTRVGWPKSGISL